eukprot:766751-Hanusia_phi.AAC.19
MPGLVELYKNKAAKPKPLATNTTHNQMQGGNNKPLKKTDQSKESPRSSRCLRCRQLEDKLRMLNFYLACIPVPINEYP